jgi:hypothetical protein
MLIVGLIYNGTLFIIGFATAGLSQASGEVLPKFGEVPVLSSLWHSMEMSDNSSASLTRNPVSRPLRKRQQMMAMIICSCPDKVAESVMHDLRRGVTALHGMGMFTHQEREVLMVAVTVTEVAQLKATVKAADPDAFMVVNPAQEVLGRGFSPLGTD